MHETRDDVFEFIHDEGIHYHQTKVLHLWGISNPEGSRNVV
jgi:hypothetical protein